MHASGSVCLSLVAHGALLVGAAFYVGSNLPREPVGTSITLALSNDLSEAMVVEEKPELDVPEIVEWEPIPEPVLPEPEEIEEIQVPDPVDWPEEATPLDVPELSLAVVSARLPREAPVAAPKPQPEPPPPPPVLVRRPQPPPVPAARSVRRAPRGRLRPVYQPKHYPADARRRGLQGLARIEVTISASGAVVAARIVQSSGHAVLDQAALSAARQWRFAPPGTPRRARLPFLYRLA